MNRKRMRMSDSEFDQNSYWIDRHQRLKGDPRSVGHAGKTLEENLAAELRIKHWVSCAARILKPYGSVLDIGCGYGRVAGSFCDAGYSYTGLDISDVAIEAARQSEPRGRYLLGSPLTETFHERFDLVCVLYVFVHFVDDSDWLALINRISNWLTPGGGLLFADSFPAELACPAPHVKLRPMSHYETAFKTTHLKLDDSFRSSLQKALGTPAIPPAQLARRSA